MKFFAWITPLLLASIACAETVSAPHVKVDYEGIDAPHAAAIANTLSAAWSVYKDEYGFDVPDQVACKVICKAGQTSRLWTDGNDTITLTMPSQQKLQPPAQSGTFNLYGMCHELGHIAMYRTLKERDWMSGAAAEGFAHYAGAVVVDRVYEAKGEKLWATPYDYRQDGTARLKRQLAGPAPADTVRGAGQWLQLEQIIGRKGFPELFAAWQAANIDAAKPQEALLAALLKVQEVKKEALTAWWKTASPILVEVRPNSGFKREEIAVSRLSGMPVKLELDDNAADGKRSSAGGGHARQFSAPAGGAWYVRAIAVHASRYGPAKAPATQFDIALCDAKMQPIAVWKKPYALFERGAEAWVRIELPPTRVPEEFFICLNFRPTATSGVYVSSDSSSKGHSFNTTPGQMGSPLKDGDWMIRVELDCPKGTDPLK